MSIAGELATHTVERLEALLRERRLGAFVRLLNESMQQCKPSADLYRLAAEYAKLTDKPAELCRFLIQWAGYAPNDPTPRWELADLLVSLGKIDGAMESLDLAEKAGADPLQVAIRRTQVLLADRRYTQAAEMAALHLAAQPAVLPGSHLLKGLSVLAGNLAVAEGRADLREMVASVAGRSLRLQAGNTGIVLVEGGAAKRLHTPQRQPDLVSQITREIKTRNCGCIVGSADLLDLVHHAAGVHDGSFWGSRSRIYVVECDEDMLALALATFDVRDVLTDEAVTWLWGPAALEQLERFLTEREDESPQNITVSSDPQVAPVVDKASQVFSRKVEALFRESSAYYAALPREHWGDIFGGSPSRPPRILLITTEFSSFMKFSIRDLASAFGRIGWQVQVAKESQPTQRMTGLTVPKAVATFRPDLIWQINFMRSAWQGGVPDGVPFVCWDQDMMPHLADRQQAAKMGRFDFLASLGTGFPYVRWHGYAPDRILTLPMGVDRSVFHAEPDVRPDTDVCFVSHHGWTPGQRIQELLTTAGAHGNDAAFQAIQLYTKQIEAYHATTGEPISQEESDGVFERVCHTQGLRFDERACKFLKDYLYRIIANAVWRQEAVQWVADCNVTLKLYGMGWENNELFSRFAAGVVEHGHSLRRVFTSSRIALQAVLTGNAHQRLWEASSCGTLVLMRYHPGDEYHTIVRQWLGTLEEGIGYPVEEVISEPMRRDARGRFAYTYIRRNLAENDGLVTDRVVEYARMMARFQTLRDKLGDAYDDLVFTSPADLRARLSLLLGDEGARQRLRECLQDVAVSHDYSVQIPRLLREIRQCLIE